MGSLLSSQHDEVDPLSTIEQERAELRMVPDPASRKPRPVPVQEGSALRPYNFHIVIMGERGVGKTNLLYRLFGYKFTEHNPKNKYHYPFEVMKLSCAGDSVVANINMWDSGDRELGWNRVDCHSLYYLRGNPQAVIIVFDKTRRSTFYNLPLVFANIAHEFQHSHRPPILVLGNKIDDTAKIEVSTGEALEYLEELNCEDPMIGDGCMRKLVIGKVAYLETSAKTGQNVFMSLMTLVTTLLEVRLQDDCPQKLVDFPPNRILMELLWNVQALRGILFPYWALVHDDESRMNEPIRLLLVREVRALIFDYLFVLILEPQYSWPREIGHR